ncbi:MAG: ABC transporter permease [bacterium]|nr:ABC transporter permease [Gammaproteobacteria bacterium]HIL94346.1 ABC transporter permease [Pseudomonadales bacterium]
MSTVETDPLIHTGPDLDPGLQKPHRPITLVDRRWRNFKANKRAWYSSWIFSVLFICSLGAELIANDKPILLYVDGGIYFPFLVMYPETSFADEITPADELFETETIYRDPFFQDLIKRQDGWMIWPMVRYANNTMDLFIEKPAPVPPSATHWLGTDDLGRDVFAKVIYGFRLSILFGLGLTICSTIIGISAGAIQGYFGGWLDLVMQRLIEMWAGMPILFLLIILASMVEPTPGWLFLLLLLFSWMALVGIVRAEFLRARNLEYVRAARALGVGNITIMAKHVLPNAMVAALTMVPFILTNSVVLLTSLDFLGFGLPSDAPSLGRLIKQAVSNLQAPWLGFTAFFTIGIMLTLLIFIGEGIRDAFDPRKTFA